MKLLFKTSGTPSTPPQIGDTNFQNHYSGVNRSMAFAELTPAIRQATEKFVLPFVGEELYDDLATKFESGATLTTAQARTLEYLQDCIAFYTVYQVLPEKNGVVSSAGVMQNTPSDGSAAPTPQWTWKAMRWSALENADLFLDRLLNFLEKQVAASVAYFDLWKNSSAYKVKTSAFFRRTADLDEFLNIKASRRSFISLVKYLALVEEDIIAPVLCGTTFDAMKTAAVAASPSANDAALLKKVRKAVAYLGLAEAIPHHRLVIDDEGFRIVSQSDQFDDRRNLTNNTHLDSIEKLRDSAERKGRQYLTELQNFLAENAATYTAWASSPCNTAAARQGHSIRISPDRVGAVGLF